MSEHQPQRRDKRYRARLPVQTRIAGRAQSLFTEDVSFRGLFLCTEAPPPVRQLIRIETVLPPDSAAFATHGMVVHVVGKDDPAGRSPGVGVQFYGMGDERRMWESYIQFIQWRAEPVPDRRSGQLDAAPRPAGSRLARAGTEQPTRPSVQAQAAGTPRPLPPRVTGLNSQPVPPLRVALGSGTHENRRFHRFAIVLEVRPHDLDGLVRMYSRDVSVGGMFLPTTRHIPIATTLRIEIRHPHAEAVFPMTAVVRRCSAQPLGIGIEFVGLDDRRRRQFFEFIHAPRPDAEEEDDGIEVLEGD